MAAYISRKNSWLRCLVSFLPAAGMAALLCILSSGPRLGPLYDFLLRRRPAPPVSSEILIIDSSVPGEELVDDILDPGAAASLLYTMTELGAGSLIIQVPVLGLSAGGNAGEAEILNRFDEEFSLLSRNIRNLFDGIRTGSVTPAESAKYVGELVDLSEKGKERLVSALVRRDEESIDRMEKAAALFGHVRRPGDLQVQLIRASGSADDSGDRTDAPVQKDEYSRARPDRDGMLRRVAPVLTVPDLAPGEDGSFGKKTLEHTVYGALKSRFRISDIENTKSGPVLANLDGKDGRSSVIPLDRDGMALFEVPHRGEDFRRIGIGDFLSYDEADRELRRLLAEGESLGIYQGIEGENNPAFLYDYALSLRDELVKTLSNDGGNGDERKKYAWIDARNRYFKSLENFLYGPSEMKLIEGYEEIIDSGPNNTNPMGVEEVARISGMRDSLIRLFLSLRARYNQVIELRTKLESSLANSFCILGKGSPGGEAAAGGIAEGAPETAPSGFSETLRNFPRTVIHRLNAAFSYTNPTDVEASALLANSILTGRAIKPGSDRYLLTGSLVAVFLICFFLKSLRPIFTLGTGLFLTLLTGAGFSISFILSGVWLSPLVPAAAGFTGVLISLVWALIAKLRYGRQFRLAYGPFVSRYCLKSVIQAGKPLPSQSVMVKAAVVAIKNSGISVSRESTSGYTGAVLAFQKEAADMVRRAGGTLTGTEGDTVTACFGSPLERVLLGGKRRVAPFEDNIHALAAPAMRALDFVSETARRPVCSSWRFGLDLGFCTFAWTAASGYIALGYPVQRAKILARLGSRYQSRVILSSAINEALPDLVVKELSTLKEKDEPGGEPFYQMIMT